MFIFFFGIFYLFFKSSKSKYFCGTSEICESTILRTSEKDKMGKAIKVQDPIMASKARELSKINIVKNYYMIGILGSILYGIDAVFRTDPILYHKFENMVIFWSGNLYTL